MSVSGRLTIGPGSRPPPNSRSNIGNRKQDRQAKIEPDFPGQPSGAQHVQTSGDFQSAHELRVGQRFDRRQPDLDFIAQHLGQGARQSAGEPMMHGAQRLQHVVADAARPVRGLAFRRDRARHWLGGARSRGRGSGSRGVCGRL
jgi:hypothetical protein